MGVEDVSDFAVAVALRTSGSIVGLVCGQDATMLVLFGTNKAGTLEKKNTSQ